MTKQITEVAIAEIVQRKELMPRKGVSDAVVIDYKASLELLPPILLGIDEAKTDEEKEVADENGKVLVLLDGWHRLQAFTEEGFEKISALVDSKAKPEDFRAIAARANKAHGRRLTADEKRAVARKLYLEENRDSDFIADVIGCSERHSRRLLESFERVKKEMYEKKALALSKKENKDTGKPYTIREIAEQLDSPSYPVSKSAVGRWLKKQDTEPEPEAPASDVKEIDYEAEESEDEEPEVVLPDKDVQSADAFLASIGEMTTTIQGIDKKAKGLSYSRATCERMETSLTILKKEMETLLDTLLDLSL